MSGLAIGHLDADCFYVSAERVRDDFLRDKPVGVLGNNGACVIARSYEMRAAGVRTGEPIWDAIKLCPQGIYVKRDFRWYEVLSRAMLEVVRTHSDCVEYYAIDEFFFTARPRPGQSMQQLASHLRDTILAKTGLPVSVGLGRSRTMAKLLSDTFKPFGAMAILDPCDERELLSRLPVTDITGIAGRRAARLAPYNIRSCLDLAQADRRLVRRLLTITGESIWRELNGERAIVLQPNRPPHKMLSRGGSIGWATSDPDVIHGWVVRNLERLIEELDFHQVRAGKLSVWLEFTEGPSGVGEVSLESPTDRFDLLLDAARQATHDAYRPGGRVVRMQVLATHLRGSGLIQRSLFDAGPSEQQERLAQVKRRINQRLGRFTLRSGATLPLKAMYRDWEAGYDICDVHGKICF